MNLLVITPEKTGPSETELVNQMLANGLPRLHIRKPSFTINEYLNYISQIEEPYRPRLVIHGHYKLFTELSLGGIHLNESMRKDPITWAQLSEIPPSKISTSFHSWDEIEKNEFRYGYVFISPVFNSISKPGYMAGIELAGAKATKHKLATENKYCPEIMGLGGVGYDQIGVLHQYGFVGAVMLGAIWDSADPLSVFLKAKKVISELKDA